MTKHRRILLLIAVCLYSLSVLTVDLHTPIGLEIWVLNLPVLLVPILFRSARMVLVVGVLCSAMVVLGSIYSAPGANPPSWDFWNRGMEIGAIWLIALMARQIIKRSTQLDDALLSLQRKELPRQLLEAAEREQQHIGHELHDSVGQELTGLGLMAQTLSQRLPGPGQEQRVATRLVTGLNHVHDQLRALARGLLPVEIESKGLLAALDDLVIRTSEHSGIEVTFECPEWTEPPDHATSMELFRITQEAVSNAMRHGRPKTIRVTMLPQPGGGLRLGIEDDGIGIPDPPPQGGLGIRIMQYRAESIHGELRLQRAQEGGTLVTVTLPGEKGINEERNGRYSHNKNLDYR